MARIKLFFESFKDENLKDHTVIRLKCGIQFKTAEGWTKPYSATIDTGAHMSVIPSSIWEKIIHETEGKYKIFGLSKTIVIRRVV